jgi:hypothetical protein
MRLKKSLKQEFSIHQGSVEAAYQLAYLYAKRNEKEKKEFYINYILEKHGNQRQSKLAKLLGEQGDMRGSNKTPIGIAWLKNNRKLFF